MLNQSVLLRGVNDRTDVLAELCRRLVDLRVMPYYLHQLDPVAGAAHFEVPDLDRHGPDGGASRSAARLRRAALRPRDAGRHQQGGFGMTVRGVPRVAIGL